MNATLSGDVSELTATGTINDNDDPAVLSIADATAVIEGATASFVVSMGASEKQVTVSYATGGRHGRRDWGLHVDERGADV